MNLRIEVVSVGSDGSEQRRQMLTIERQELAMETLGMSWLRAKHCSKACRIFMIAQQVSEDLEQRRACPHCGQRHTAKDSGSTPVKTLFGPVNVPNPRWNRCECQTQAPKTFRPTAAWLHGRTSAEMLYLESKWASLIPFAKVADLLRKYCRWAIQSIRKPSNRPQPHAGDGGTDRAEVGRGAATECVRRLRKTSGSNRLCRTVRSRWASMAATCGRHVNRGVLK